MQCWIVATGPFPEKAIYGKFFLSHLDAEHFKVAVNRDLETDIYKVFECLIQSALAEEIGGGG